MGKSWLKVPDVTAGVTIAASVVEPDVRALRAMEMGDLVPELGREHERVDIAGSETAGLVGSLHFEVQRGLADSSGDAAAEGVTIFPTDRSVVTSGVGGRVPVEREEVEVEAERRGRQHPLCVSAPELGLRIGLIGVELVDDHQLCVKRRDLPVL